MSIRVMNEVWTSSHTKGTQRLMMVALADHAGDDGTCWPSVIGLAEKCNTTERNTQLILRELEDSGELLTDLAAGRGHKNLYRVLAPATSERLIQELGQHLEKVKSSDEKVKVSALLEKVKSSAEKVKVSAQKVKSTGKKVKPTSPEPSGTIKEPTEEPTAAAGDQTDSGLLPDEAGQPGDVQQGSATGTDAPSGADGTPPPTLTEPDVTQTNATPSTATASPKVPGGAALAVLTGALLGMKQTVPELIAEYDDRQGWLEIAPARIRDLVTEARQAHGNRRYRGALIDALDEEVRLAQLSARPAVLPTEDDDIDMAALIDGAPLEGNRRRV